MNHLLASGPHLAVIPTLTALAVRHFKHKQGQDGGDAELEPKHPAVKFVLGAWNEGDFGEARKHIAPDIEIYTNGLSFSSEHGGPAMVKESIESWRALAPDVRMELSQEICEKHGSQSSSGSPQPTPGTSLTCRRAAGRSTSRAPRS